MGRQNQERQRLILKAKQKPHRLKAPTFGFCEASLKKAGCL